MAIAVQQKYNAMRRPADKEKFQAKIGKSYRDMLSALKEDSVSAQQAAIAISKKERGEKPKKESVLDRIDKKSRRKTMGKKYFDTKDTTLESSILSVWQEAAKKNEDKLDPVNKNAVKKKFDDRKDKDIDNDGDVDSSDKFLHKRRKAVSKSIANEGIEEFAVADDVPAMEIGTDRYRDHTLEVTPGQDDPEWVAARDFKVASMKEALAKVWGLDEKALDKSSKEEYDEEDEELKPVKGSKTMTGGKVAKVDIQPKIDG